MFVDGVNAGVWEDLGADGVHRWRDSSLRLPAALTAGKSRITVRVEFASSGAGLERVHLLDLLRPARRERRRYRHPRRRRPGQRDRPRLHDQRGRPGAVPSSPATTPPTCSTTPASGCSGTARPRPASTPRLDRSSAWASSEPTTLAHWPVGIDSNDTLYCYLPMPFAAPGHHRPDQHPHPAHGRGDRRGPPPARNTGTSPTLPTSGPGSPRPRRPPSARTSPSSTPSGSGSFIGVTASFAGDPAALVPRGRRTHLCRRRQHPRLLRHRHGGLLQRRLLLRPRPLHPTAVAAIPLTSPPGASTAPAPTGSSCRTRCRSAAGSGSLCSTAGTTKPPPTSGRWPTTTSNPHHAAAHRHPRRRHRRQRNRPRLPHHHRRPGPEPAPTSTKAPPTPSTSPTTAAPTAAPANSTSPSARSTAGSCCAAASTRPSPTNAPTSSSTANSSDPGTSPAPTASTNGATPTSSSHPAATTGKTSITVIGCGSSPPALDWNEFTYWAYTLTQ